jgi:hypothetical protein
LPFLGRRGWAVVPAEPIVSRNAGGVASDVGPRPHAAKGGRTKQGRRVATLDTKALLHIPSSARGQPLDEAPAVTSISIRWINIGLHIACAKNVSKLGNQHFDRNAQTEG